MLYLYKTEKFQMTTLRGTSNINGKPSNNLEVKSLNDSFINPYSMGSKEMTNYYNTKALREKQVLKDQKYFDNIVQTYEQILRQDNDDVTYFQNDEIDQSKITENAFDVINQIDNIDYSKVITGYQKCLKSCPNGMCIEGGYRGTASCIPMPESPFDWGTFYKNPEFTYGLDVPYNNVNNKEY